MPSLECGLNSPVQAFLIRRFDPDMARDFRALDFRTELDDNHLLDILTS
jgi:hypothetical protein